MTAAASSVLGRPLWFELMTSDKAAAEGFYKAVVGWTTTPFKESPQPYRCSSATAEYPLAAC